MSDSNTLKVSDEDQGTRLDRYIASSPLDISRNYVATLIESGAVRVNGDPFTAKKYQVCAGDEIEVDIPDPENVDIIPEDIPIDIVYEDDDVIVVDKARGMVVHPAPGNYTGTLVNAIMFHCGNTLSSINGEKRPGIVHRIDKDTSGLIMIAKNDAAHESLASQLADHSVNREYTALCLDNIKEDNLTIDAPIGRDPRNRLRRAVNVPGAREAVTHISVMERYGGCTLVSARLETGRTHQIRVHMAYIKHPLVGDKLYGPKSRPASLRGIKLPHTDENGTGGQMLHAGTLGFVHPSSGEYMEFTSPLPEYFTEVLDKIKF